MTSLEYALVGLGVLSVVLACTAALLWVGMARATSKVRVHREALMLLAERLVASEERLQGLRTRYYLHLRNCTCRRPSDGAPE